MNTLKLDISELEIGENQVEISQRNYDRYFDYNETCKTSVILQPNSNYKNIAFSEVTSPFALIVTSDKLINARINGFEITNTQIVVLNTAIQTVEVANVDLEEANVNIFIWGNERG